MLYHRLIAAPGNADHVEARIALVELVFVQKVLRRLNHFTLLA